MEMCARCGQEKPILVQVIVSDGDGFTELQYWCMRCLDK